MWGQPHGSDSDGGRSGRRHGVGRRWASLPHCVLSGTVPGMRLSSVFSFLAPSTAAAVVSLAPLGCGGGKLQSGVDAGVGADGAPWGTEGGPWSPECPAAQPSAGSSCAGVMTVCEYGDAWWDVSCDTVLSCANGTWALSPPSQGSCVPAPGPNPAACPTDPSTIQKSASCPEDQLDCYYGMGTSCICTVGAVHPDAGPTWSCAPEPGCPSTRPRLGSSCSESTQVCGYGVGSAGVGEQCLNGTWQPAGPGGG
jgi:hypothetical protein